MAGKSVPGRLLPGKPARGRPRNSGLLLQCLPGGVIVNMIVPLQLYRCAEDAVLKYYSGELTSRQCAGILLDIVEGHRAGSGIIEVYKQLDTTTTDLRKYRILEIMHIPTDFGPLSLIPGTVKECEYSLNLRTGRVKLKRAHTKPGRAAIEHKNPDRKETCNSGTTTEMEGEQTPSGTKLLSSSAQDNTE